MDTKTKILETADRMFRERGYKAVTMDMLAAEVGMSKKTLYQHYENKTDLVEAVRDVSYKEYHKAFADIAEKAENAIEAFLGFNKLLLEISRNANPMAFYELERFFPQVYEIFRNELLKQSIEITRKNLEQGIKEGLYRPEINLDLLSYYRVDSALMSMHGDTLMYKAGFSLEQISCDTAEHFLYGLLTPAGVKVYQKLIQKQPE